MTLVHRVFERLFSRSFESSRLNILENGVPGGAARPRKCCQKPNYDTADHRPYCSIERSCCFRVVQVDQRTAVAQVWRSIFREAFEIVNAAVSLGEMPPWFGWLLLRRSCRRDHRESDRRIRCLAVRSLFSYGDLKLSESCQLFERIVMRQPRSKRNVNSVSNACSAEGVFPVAGILVT